jgi:ethanolamine utilization protein EutQ (cupin superfamily)
VSEYDAMAPNARRFPRVITEDEITTMPRLLFNTGIDTAIFLSLERDDARYFRQGYCFMEPDHEPYNWAQVDFDETHFCLSGRIHLEVKDADGRVVVLEAGEGEHIYLPAGYEYTLTSTGVKSSFFWTSGPSPASGLEEKSYAATLRALRSE